MFEMTRYHAERDPAAGRSPVDEAPNKTDSHAVEARSPSISGGSAAFHRGVIAHSE